MLPRIKGKYFEGRTLTSQDVILSINNFGVVSSSPILFAPVEISELEIEARTGNLPIVINFPDGGMFQSYDYEGLNLWITKHQPKVTSSQSFGDRIAFLIGTVLFLIMFAVAILLFGSSDLTRLITDNLPAEANEYISENLLGPIDDLFSGSSDKNKTEIKMPEDSVTNTPSPEREAQVQKKQSKKPGMLIEEPTLPTDSTHPDIFKLRVLLESEDFITLHEQLDQYQRNVEEGTGSEITLDTAYQHLAYANPDNEAKFTKWIEIMPDAYTAYLARAEYYFRVSWKKRGGAYRKDTSESQMEGMRHYHKLAKNDLVKAQELKPNSFLIQPMWISLEGAGGDKRRQRDEYLKALKIKPNTYLARRDMLYYLLPRWGGSYVEMERILKETERHINTNPELKPLLGYVNHAKSFAAHENEQYEQAILLNTTALKSGKKSWFYEKRASAYYKLKDYESAYANYINAIYFNPYDEGLYYWRGKTEYKLGNIDAAVKDMEYAAKIDPYDKGTQNWLGWFYKREKRYEEAKQAYRKVLEYNPYDAKAWSKLGLVYRDGFKEHEQAKQAFLKAVSYKPKNAQYWYYYGGILNAMRDCDVVPALESYLKLCEDENKEGCFEKGIDWSEGMVKKLKQSYCKE